MRLRSFCFVLCSALVFGHVPGPAAQAADAKDAEAKTVPALAAEVSPDQMMAEMMKQGKIGRAHV